MVDTVSFFPNSYTPPSLLLTEMSRLKGQVLQRRLFTSPEAKSLSVQATHDNSTHLWFIERWASGAALVKRSREQFYKTILTSDITYKFVGLQDHVQVQHNNRLGLTELELPWCSEGKESVSNAGDSSSVPGLGRSPGEGNGNLLQYSCLENPMDRGAWQATVHGVAKSWTQLSNQHFHFHRTQNSDRDRVKWQNRWLKVNRKKYGRPLYKLMITHKSRFT